MANVNVTQFKAELDDLRDEVAQVKEVQAQMMKLIQGGDFPVCQVERVTTRQMRAEMDEYKMALQGTSDKPGLIILVDRLNQSMRQISWLGGVVAALLIADIVSRVLG